MKRSPAVDESLLQPSLAEESLRLEPIYSPTVMALTAFFGGPFAIIAITALNSEKLKRLRADALWLGVAALLSIVFIHSLNAGAPIDMSAATAAVQPRVLLKAFSLALFGVFYAMHRRAHRSMQFAALKTRSAWGIALACVLFGWVAQGAVLVWARQ